MFPQRPKDPTPAETWTHLAMTAAIWFLLYSMTPSKYTETAGAAGVITFFFLGVVALGLAVLAWMISPPRLQRAFLHLRWLVPVAFLAVAFSEQRRSERDAQLEQARMRALSAAPAGAPAESAPPRASPPPLPGPAGVEDWPPPVNELLSAPLPAELKSAERLVVVYRWGNRRELRFPIRLSEGYMPDAIVQRMQAMVDGRDVPLVVELDEQQRLRIGLHPRASLDDRWMVGTENADSVIGLPLLPQRAD